MKLGLGLNVWAKGLSKNHLDGIGVYSRELYQALLQHSSSDGWIRPYVFSDYSLHDIEHVQKIPTSFLKHVLASQCMGQRLELSELDVFHAPDHMIPRLKKTPVIATVHDLIPFIHPEWARSNKVLRYVKNTLFKNTILSADHIITISQHSKNDLMNYLGIPEDKISVVYFGINPAFYQRMDADEKNKVLDHYHLKPGFFLFIGTLQPRKNLEKCLEAHALLSHEERLLHPLVIVGAVGWASVELLEHIHQAEQKHYVKWLRFCPDDAVKCFLQSAIALLFVSLYEGFGMPILEAFASECPVISSNVSAVPEFARDAAILVNPYDVYEISSAMKKIMTDAENRIKLIAKAYTYVQSFTWEACASQTIEVYKNFMK